MPENIRMVANGGVDIATQSFGSPHDPALLLIMGATASMLSWPDSLCEALVRQGLFVIRFDHRDTGQTTTMPPGQGNYTVEDMAGDVAAIMDAYSLLETHLMGMSLGGYIGQMVALQHPDRVSSLTLIGSEPLGWDGLDLPHIGDEFMGHFNKLAALDWTDGAAVAEFLLESERICTGSGNMFDEAAMKAVVARVLARTGSPASMYNHGTVSTTGDWKGRFRDIACPVLVIHGEDDPILPLPNGQAIAEGIPGAELFIMQGVGHELPLVLAEEIADMVGRFVELVVVPPART